MKSVYYWLAGLLLVGIAFTGLSRLLVKAGREETETAVHECNTACLAQLDNQLMVRKTEMPSGNSVVLEFSNIGFGGYPPESLFPVRLEGEIFALDDLPAEWNCDSEVSKPKLEADSGIPSILIGASITGSEVEKYLMLSSFKTEPATKNNNGPELVTLLEVSSVNPKAEPLPVSGCKVKEHGFYGLEITWDNKAQQPRYLLLPAYFDFIKYGSQVSPETILGNQAYILTRISDVYAQ